MDFNLSDEQKLIAETAREFADREILPRVRENDRAERFDREPARKLGAVGFLGPILAERHGGRDLDHVGYGLIVGEIGRADSSARTVVSVQTSLVGPAIERWGTEEQKQRWLPGLCAGEGLGCFGLTEPDTGSDAANLRTRATKTDAGWSISGQKVAKVYATESAVECANLAIQVHGGSGYVDDYPVERYLRDARVTTLYEGTSQIQKLIIGRAATGIDAMTPVEA